MKCGQLVMLVNFVQQSLNLVWLWERLQCTRNIAQCHATLCVWLNLSLHMALNSSHKLSRQRLLWTCIWSISPQHVCITWHKPGDAGGPSPVAKGAHITLTANLWQEVGPCNGAAGTVYDIVYQEGYAPPNLPIAVLVQFETTQGLQFTPKLSRQYATTFHKSQGQTLKEKPEIEVVDDIGELASNDDSNGDKEGEMSTGVRDARVMWVLQMERYIRHALSARVSFFLTMKSRSGTLSKVWYYAVCQLVYQWS